MTTVSIQLHSVLELPRTPYNHHREHACAEGRQGKIELRRLTCFNAPFRHMSKACYKMTAGTDEGFDVIVHPCTKRQDDESML